MNVDDDGERSCNGNDNIRATGMKTMKSKVVAEYGCKH